MYTTPFVLLGSQGERGIRGSGGKGTILMKHSTSLAKVLQIRDSHIALNCQCGHMKWSHVFTLGIEVGQRPQMLIHIQVALFELLVHSRYRSRVEILDAEYHLIFSLNCQCGHIKWSHDFIPGTEVGQRSQMLNITQLTLTPFYVATPTVQRELCILIRDTVVHMADPITKAYSSLSRGWRTDAE